MTVDEAVEIVRPLFNSICIICDMELVRVIGFGYDDMDYYYITKHKNGRIVWETFVGHCVSLKDIYPRYDRMEELFHINHCPREENLVL